jgi:hypothetical protein
MHGAGIPREGAMIGIRGRKPKWESRSAEFRQRLIAWKQTPESSRPSLRGLACELGTSHQLLKHYLKGLEEWQHKERFRQAKKALEGILARAQAENRFITPGEEQQFCALAREALRAMVTPVLLNQLQCIKQDAKRGPLHGAQIKMLKLFARQEFPGAKELLKKCQQSSAKNHDN